LRITNEELRMKSTQGARLSPLRPVIPPSLCHSERSEESHSSAGLGFYSTYSDPLCHSERSEESNSTAGPGFCSTCPAPLRHSERSEESLDGARKRGQPPFPTVAFSAQPGLQGCAAREGARPGHSGKW